MKLWFMYNALHIISTIMHIKFEDVQAEMTKLYSRQAENAVKILIIGK